MTKYSITFLACLPLILQIGCTGGTPKGFPKVVPCDITVLDGTTPIADVEIVLQATAASEGLVFFGKTDGSGVCKVGTSFANHYKEGVPEGSYKIILTKEPFVEDTKTREEQNEMSRTDLDAYKAQMQAKRDALPKIIPDALTTANTPLTIAVQGKTEMEIDVTQHK